MARSVSSSSSPGRSCAKLATLSCGRNCAAPTRTMRQPPSTTFVIICGPAPAAQCWPPCLAAGMPHQRNTMRQPRSNTLHYCLPSGSSCAMPGHFVGATKTAPRRRTPCVSREATDCDIPLPAGSSCAMLAIMSCGRNCAAPTRAMRQPVSETLRVVCRPAAAARSWPPCPAAGTAPRGRTPCVSHEATLSSMFCQPAAAAHCRPPCPLAETAPRRRTPCVSHEVTLASLFAGRPQLRDAGHLPPLSCGKNCRANAPPCVGHKAALASPFAVRLQQRDAGHLPALCCGRNCRTKAHHASDTKQHLRRCLPTGRSCVTLAALSFGGSAAPRNAHLASATEQMSDYCLRAGFNCANLALSCGR